MKSYITILSRDYFNVFLCLGESSSEATGDQDATIDEPACPETDDGYFACLPVRLKPLKVY